VKHNIKVGIKGLFQLEAFKPILNDAGEIIGEVENSRREIMPWSPNMLLTSGKNRMGSHSDWLNACQVGDDGTLPTVNDTGLLGYTVGTSNIQDTIVGAQGSYPWYGFKRKRFRFALGAVVGNIAEVGVGWSTANGPNLVSRTLIVNIFGDPTVATILADEILDVNYEFRYYPPLVDSIGTVTLNGVDYNYKIRASEVSNSTAWGLYIGEDIGVKGSLVADWQAYNGTIGAITLAPNGVAAPINETSWGAQVYSNNSFQRVLYCQCGPTGWNAPGGIRSIRIKTSAGYYQTEFGSIATDAPIPKNSSFTMYMEWIISWVTATPIFSGTIGNQSWTIGVDPSFDTSTFFSGAPDPITYSLYNGILPTGTSLNSSTGVIEGTPTTSESGVITIQCANAVGEAVSNEFSWSVS